MNTRGGPSRVAGCLLAATLLVGCSSSSPTPTAAGPTSTPVTIRIELGVTFESSNAYLKPGVLDIYAPLSGGPWPVAVLFHGDPTNQVRGALRPHAERLVDAGFVVFAPSWAKYPGAYPNSVSELVLDQGEIAQAACAVAFAQAHAAEYGGDSSRTITFGHSAGSVPASVVAFAQPAPSPDCLAGQALDIITGLVIWDGEVLLGGPFFDRPLAEEPALWDAYSAWPHLASRPDMRVAFAVSEDPMNGRADGPWLDDRSPDGEFRRLAEEIGALDDGYFGLDEMQAMFAQALRERGHSVFYEVMPGSNHFSVGDDGWEIFVDAFKSAAAVD